MFVEGQPLLQYRRICSSLICVFHLDRNTQKPDVTDITPVRALTEKQEVS